MLREKHYGTAVRGTIRRHMDKAQRLERGGNCTKVAATEHIAKGDGRAQRLRHST